MAAFLKIVSGFYLLIVWLGFGVFVSVPTTGYGMDALAVKVGAFLAVISLSIPAVALYAFGQVVGDIRATRNHLHAMRKYYEPSQRYEGM